jgi:hypothetical protein
MGDEVSEHTTHFLLGSFSWEYACQQHMKEEQRPIIQQKKNYGCSWD